MQASIQTQQYKKNQSKLESEGESYQEQDQYDQTLEKQKDKRIKKLTLTNRELIETLKQQNQILTKHINKQRLKPNRSLNTRKPGQNTKEAESIKKQLQNSYKQIDMYKNALQILKAKESSIDAVEKVTQLQDRIKLQDAIIQQIQKEIKYVAHTRQQQQRQLKLFQNDQVKNQLIQLEQQSSRLKEQIKVYKMASIKKQNISKKQQAYLVELEIALRKLNDQYYPGKQQNKKIEPISDLNEAQWKQLLGNVNNLKKMHQQYLKKIQLVNKQKLKQLKSNQQNELKLKEKNRKLQTLRSKVVQLHKLATIKQTNKQSIKGLNDEPPLGNRTSLDIVSQPIIRKKEKVIPILEANRQVKKWTIPSAYCLEKGKIMPNSLFFSDKGVLANSKKNKITKIHIWVDVNGKPSVLQFFYQDIQKGVIEGLQPFGKIDQFLSMEVWEVKEGDYLIRVSGTFKNGEMTQIKLKSKFGKQTKFETNESQEGQMFNFQGKTNEIPSCFFGAYIKGKQNIGICHLGCQFISDW